jgi:hypothetical protein
MTIAAPPVTSTPTITIDVPAGATHRAPKLPAAGTYTVISNAYIVVTLKTEPNGPTVTKEGNEIEMIDGSWKVKTEFDIVKDEEYTITAELRDGAMGATQASASRIFQAT